MIVGGTPGRSALTSLLNSYTTLGVDVAYTELDVRFESLPPSSAAVTQQANDWVNLVMSCFDVARCVGLTIWDYTDKVGVFFHPITIADMILVLLDPICLPRPRRRSPVG